MSNLDGHSRRAVLANVRQELLTPARALVGYSELLRDEAEQREFHAMLPDLARILTAAEALSERLDRLLEQQQSAVVLETAERELAEQALRHDLRTPLGAISGYGEMLLEELEDQGVHAMRSDLEKLLIQSNRLLDCLDTIVLFSRGEDDQVALEAHSNIQTAEIVSGLARSIRSIDENRIVRHIGNVLVVDDIESNRDLLARRLSRDGHTVALADDGEKALTLLRSQSFDLVLLDLMMPGVNGYEVLLRMKADSQLRNIPVIVLSALQETDSVIRCMEAGADDFLSKPFDPVLLRARIKSGLQAKQWSDDERRQRRFIKKAFSRFMSPTVVDQLVEDPGRLSLGGERLNITCLFTDLAGFTRLIEESDPTEVIPVLNDYLDGMCKIVLEHHGTIDKIVGDALNAFFGAPLPQSDHPQRALDCALALDTYAKQFRLRQDAQILDFGKTRIGVHSGIAVVGNFGGEQFFDYTAYGDVVNTTARMESVNKQLGTTVCVSDSTAQHSEEIPFRPIGKLQFKGKVQAVQAFEPISVERNNSHSVTAYREAYRMLEEGDSRARDAFEQLAENYPDDPLVVFHANRLKTGNLDSLIVLDEK